MRKQFKKVLSMVLSAAMVLTLGSGLELKTASAETLTLAGTYDAHLGCSLNEWGKNDANKMGVINFNGTDTAEADLQYSGASGDGFQPVLCVDITGLGAAASAAGLVVDLVDFSMKADDKAVTVDNTKLLTGDLENNGKYRIEIYNEWGDGTTKNDPPLTWSEFKFEASLKIHVKLKLKEKPAPTPTPVPTNSPTPRPTRDPGVTAAPRPTAVTSGTPDQILTTKGIHAYLFYQTDAWDCRNAYEEGKLNDQYGPNYIKAGGVESFDGDEFTVTDVQLDHDGEYTVSLSGIDLSNGNIFNMLGISTDLDPAVYPGVTATLSALKIDGTEVANPISKSLSSKSDADFYTYMLVNIYAQKKNEDAWSDAKETAPYFASKVPMPESKIEVTFTIAGLEEALFDIDANNYTQPDNGNKTKPDLNPTPTPPAGNDPTPTPPVGGGATPTPTPPAGGNATPSPTPGAGTGGTGTDAVVGAKVGATVTVGTFKLKVTKAATAKAAGTATVTGLSKSGKKAKSLNVKDSVKSGAASYKVNAIGKNAFKGAAATSITLNKSITKIPAGAFANCKKLNKLTLKAKLKSVAKKSFKGCKKKITVKGTGKKANVKLLKKSGYKKFK